MTATTKESTTFYWKGRVALYAILKAMGIGPGDQVIVPGFTCVVVPQAVRFAGAEPVYADIRSDTLNLDPEHVAALVTPRTRAVIVQHTFGLPADVDAVQAAAPGVRIIEDCAHTAGSLYKEKKVGTLGDAAFFSTQWSKPFTTGLGGMAVTRDAELASKLECLERQFQPPSKQERTALTVQYELHRRLFTPSIYWTAVDVLHLLSRLGLFVGSSTTAELDGDMPPDYPKQMAPYQRRAFQHGRQTLAENSLHRRRITRFYEQAGGQIGLRTITPPKWADAVLLRYPVLAANKERVLTEAKKRRIELGDWFISPLHPLTEGWQAVSYTPGQCPQAEAAARQVINLPNHPRVDGTTAGHVCEFLGQMQRQGWL